MFEEICDTAFWNDSASWNTTDPDLSLCLQSTVLIWVPCFLLFLFLPYEVWQNFQSKRRKLSWSLLSAGKLLFNVVLVILSAVKLTCKVQRYISNAYPSDNASILGSTVMCATHIAILITTLHREQKGLRVSFVLPVFWILWTLATWAMAYSSIRDKDFWLNNVPYNGKVEYIITVTIPVFVTLQLILSAFTEPQCQNQFVRLDNDENDDTCQLTSNSLFNYILFLWMNRSMFQGMKGKLLSKNLPPICSELTSRSITRVYESVNNRNESYTRLTERSVESKYTSLSYKLWGTCWKTFTFGCLLEFVNIVIDYLPPFMLQKLLDFVSSDEPAWHGYLYGTLFCLGTAISSIAYNLCDYCFYICSLKCKTSLISSMYKKILRLSSASRQEFPSGEILNMMSTDVVQIYTAVQYFSTLWGAPIRITLTLIYLWHYLGVSSLASLGVIVVLVGLSFFQGTTAEKLQTKVMHMRDQRLKQINEILNGIKILKLYAWEKPFVKRVLHSRKEELKSLRTYCFLNAFFVFLWVSAPIMICAACFVCFVLTGHNLDAATAFVSLSLINILRFPMGMISFVAVQLITAIVSKRRIEKFLNCQDSDFDAVRTSTDQGVSLTFSSASLSWTENPENPTLEKINLHVSKGSLVAVVGRVGSGKSSLFSAIIKDMYKLSGTITVQGTMAYVPQQAWIQNATVQKNIIFTKPFTEQKYNRILDACALRPDLNLFTGGDQTEIGEKGINLSGGQKQRVSLARAAYQDADIYLLDDPLSAVDANVAAHIFKKLIGPTGVLKNKTRIFATHNVSFLPEVDHIIVLSEGHIVEEGSYSELMASKGPLADLMQQYASGLIVNKDTEEISQEKKMSRQESVISKTSVDEEETEFAPLISEEAMEKGKVSWSVYRNYASKTGVWIFLTIVIFYAFCSATDVGSGVWLGKWTDGTITFSSPMTGLGIYCGFVFLQAFLVYFCYILLFVGTIRASSSLHEGLLNSVIRAPLSYFDTTPSGRIVNRFSNDMETVDTQIPWLWGNFFNWICTLPATLIVILVSSSPYLLILFIPLMGFYVVILRAYVITSNQLQRFSRVSNSPVMSCFTETIQGYGSIRAFSVQEHFVDDCHNKLDENNKCSYYSGMSGRWLDSVLAIISTLITLAVTFLAVWERGDILPGMLGLVLTYCVEVSMCLNWLVKMGAELESSIVSVERIQEYSTLKSEDLWEKPDNKPSELWPEHGEIMINDFSTQYREGLDPVLKNVNLKIAAGAKVGIAGRTGAGKSSFILSLFRIIEPTSGTIVIDGVDITKIGIHDLRSKLTVIPQDPVLFGVPLRKNLDPLDEYSDDQIWQALEMAHLKDFVESLSEGLNYEISEGGDNISAGQRQLVCLARALLRKTKVLILDEATASVDLDTDHLIQRTVEEAFSDCTVITIAHRLQTIMKCQQILVFSEGQLVENDSPEKLLKNTSTIFHSMGKESGLV